MEEFDDLIQKPDEDGLLDLSHRAWVKLDDSLWEFGQTLLILNLSYNNISELGPGVGELLQIRELDVSCNSLESIPPEIGKCTRLKRLKCNGNQLKTLPPQIKGCKLLEELVASENGMHEIPPELGTLDMLVVLKLQNNNLKELPPELGDCLSLDDVDVSLNDDLDMIPMKLRTDAALIVWLCQQAKAHRKKLDDMSEIISEMEELKRNEDEERIKMRDNYKNLQNQLEMLEAQFDNWWLLVGKTRRALQKRIKSKLGFSSKVAALS